MITFKITAVILKKAVCQMMGASDSDHMGNDSPEDDIPLHGGINTEQPLMNICNWVVSKVLNFSSHIHFVFKKCPKSYQNNYL
jgi:hypothetical protein